MFVSVLHITLHVLLYYRWRVMVKHNNVVPNGHFKKHWQNYVKTWFNQPARKTRRRVGMNFSFIVSSSLELLPSILFLLSFHHLQSRCRIALFLTEFMAMMCFFSVFVLTLQQGRRRLWRFFHDQLLGPSVQLFSVKPWSTTWNLEQAEVSHLRSSR